MSRLNQYGGGKDLYKILRIQHTASANDIKVSYKAIAMEIHPDKHNGCSTKVEQLKEVNEAYSILKDSTKRREYDIIKYGTTYSASTTDTLNRPKQDGWTNKNRKSPLPKDYRKVYTQRPPPPEWNNVTWDHELHDDMHYGQGFRKQALHDAINDAKKKHGIDFEYQSPLGRGFTFAFIDDYERASGSNKSKKSGSSNKSHASSASSTSSRHSSSSKQQSAKQQFTNSKLFDSHGNPIFFNPYSKKTTKQGPPKFSDFFDIEYSEWEMSDQTQGKMKKKQNQSQSQQNQQQSTNKSKRDYIIDELHSSRSFRREVQRQRDQINKNYNYNANNNNTNTNKTQQQRQQEKLHRDIKSKVLHMEEKKRYDSIRDKQRIQKELQLSCVIL